MLLMNQTQNNTIYQITEAISKPQGINYKNEDYFRKVDSPRRLHSP